MRILCPPAAAIRSALFACSCPWIDAKSTTICVRGVVLIFNFGLGTTACSQDNILTASPSVEIPMTSISGMTEASSILATGRNMRFIPISRASIVAGRAH